MPIRPSVGSRFSEADFTGEQAIPDGWQWYHMPHFYGPGDADPGQLNLVCNSRTPYATARERVKALRDFCVQLDWYVEFSGQKMLEGKNVPIYARINPAIGQSRHGPNGYCLTGVTCPYTGCGAFTDPFEDTCSSCGGRIQCAGCGGELISHGYNILYEGTDAGFVPEGVEEGARWVGCTGCFGHCQYRETVEATPQQVAEDRLLGRPRRARRPAGATCSRLCPSGERVCPEHNDPVTCAGCTEVWQRGIDYLTHDTDGDRDFCQNCMVQRCVRCFVQRQSGQQWRAMDSGHVCNECWRIANQARLEIIDRDARLSAEQLLIPALPDRPTRVVSIEQEFERGDSGTPHISHEVALALYRAGLSCYSERMRYHSGDHNYPAHVERDSSVESGGELIYNRLQLDTQMDAQHMASIADLVKERVENGHIAFTVKCGTHIHIDLHNYTIEDARNYVTMYCYLEDVIFRLGAAGYGDHRSVVSKSDYAKALKKDKYGSLVDFGVNFLRTADHTDSLNMQHFYNSLRTCECGAIEFGNIANCTCRRTKCTAEWRVFNGTGNPIKLHAWVAFVQALTSWCKDRDLDWDAYEPLGFEQGIDFTKDLGDAHNNLIEAWRPRLEWIWANLPLTDGEKDSLMYCIKASPLKHVGEDFLAALSTIERIPEPGRELAAVTAGSRFAEGEEPQPITPPSPEQLIDEGFLNEEGDEWDEDDEPF